MTDTGEQMGVGVREQPAGGLEMTGGQDAITVPQTIRVGRGCCATAPASSLRQPSLVPRQVASSRVVSRITALGSGWPAMASACSIRTELASRRSAKSSRSDIRAPARVVRRSLLYRTASFLHSAGPLVVLVSLRVRP